MSSPLRALILEDNQSDARLMVNALRQADFEVQWERVDSEPEYLNRLSSGVDIILSDYSMPQFDALKALQLLHARGLDIPFIIISGSIGEDIAVTALQMGAADYLLKDRLGRLSEAVKHALEQKQLREQSRRDTAALVEQTRLATMTADVGVALTKSDDLRDILRVCIESIVRNLDAAYARIWTLNETDNILEMQATAGLFKQIDGPYSHVPVGQFKVGMIAQERAPYVTNNLLEDSLVGDRDLAVREGLTAFAGYPLIVEGRLVGVVAMHSRQALTDSTLDALASVANLIALGIQRRTSEEALRAATKRLHHVVTSSPAVLFTLGVENDQLRGISWMSDNVFDMLGYPRTETHTDWWMEHVHPDDLQSIVETVARDLFGRGYTVHEYRFRHRDGRYRWVRGEIRLLRDSEGKPKECIGSWSDVTDRRQIEDQLRQAQKMEAVGRLAGGVAHDFNNLLTVINGYGELLLDHLPAGDPLRRMVKEVVAAGDRAAGLTRQLLAFSRKSIIEPKVLDLKALVTDVDKLLRRVIGEDVQLSIVIDPELGAIKADPGQIEQVIMNLVVNSRDAMPQGGKLTLELQNVEFDDTYVLRHPEAQSGRHVLLAVSDTGCGMDQATMVRVFEPFFTTKGEHGTGLGLATVHGIVKQSGGHIAIYSEVGLGTTFKVYLPRVAMPVPLSKSHHGLAKIPRGNETILLVEDEDGVRALTRNILQSSGYNVLAARDGAEALRAAGQSPVQIDLLVTDVVMPRMGGREVAEQVAEIHPGVKVLFFSGYTDDAVVRHGILEAEVAFLQKPFSPASLATKVREVLDRPETSPSRVSREVATEDSKSAKVAMPPNRVLLVDDHSILRAGIRKILQKLPDTEVVAEASDGREALALVAEHHPDVVFMDIAMGGLNGLEATARLTKEFPDIRVVILSMHADEEHVWKALRAGAAGYLLKHAEPAEIELALATVVRGESYITPAVSKHIVAEFIRRGGAEASSVELLTSRQREVLQLLAEGKNVKEISRILSISAKTVETHRSQLMERLDIHDLTGLVRYAIRVGLIQLDS